MDDATYIHRGCKDAPFAFPDASNPVRSEGSDFISHSLSQHPAVHTQRHPHELPHTVHAMRARAPSRTHTYAYVNTNIHIHMYAHMTSARARVLANTGVVLPFAPRRGSSARLRMCSSRQGREEERTGGLRGAQRVQTQRSETQNGSLSPPFRIRLAGIPTSTKVHGRAMPRPLLREHHRNYVLTL